MKRSEVVKWASNMGVVLMIEINCDTNVGNRRTW